MGDGSSNSSSTTTPAPSDGNGGGTATAAPSATATVLAPAPPATPGGKNTSNPIAPASLAILRRMSKPKDKTSSLHMQAREAAEKRVTTKVANAAAQIIAVENIGTPPMKTRRASAVIQKHLMPKCPAPASDGNTPADQANKGKASSRGNALSHRVRLIGKIPLFNGTTPEEKEGLASALGVKVFLTGTVIMKQGEVGSEMYVIAAGSVDIIADLLSSDGTVIESRTVSRREKGSFLGEESLLQEVNWCAHVVAASTVTALTLDRPSFMKVVGSEQRCVLAQSFAIRKWETKEPFLTVIRENKFLGGLFMKHLEKRYAHETLLFITRVRVYTDKIKTHKSAEKAHPLALEIFKEFIHVDGPHQVNTTFTQRNAIEEAIQSVSDLTKLRAFNEVVSKIEREMYYDLVPDFQENNESYRAYMRAKFPLKSLQNNSTACVVQ